MNITLPDLRVKSERIRTQDLELRSCSSRDSLPNSLPCTKDRFSCPFVIDPFMEKQTAIDVNFMRFEPLTGEDEVLSALVMLACATDIYSSLTDEQVKD